MGITKTYGYSETQLSLAAIAKAMAHPGRIAILQQLMKNKECQCGELAEHIGLAQSTVSQHLKELKQAGLIRGKIEGDKPCYCLSQVKTEEIEKFLDELKKASEIQNKDCC